MKLFIGSSQLLKRAPLTLTFAPALSIRRNLYLPLSITIVSCPTVKRIDAARAMFRAA
jgi:hypothetical protein